ncbi:hypothetical protein ACFYPT_16250 [Streptomyces sp. NPDC005529]|uniref:hypothetical protein n=1 Tax=unclassified Streptomyces TaxID=2593676 RepID=UPI0033AE2F59
MSAARRSLLTATAAGTLLGALWFVPSANASPDVPSPSGSAPASAPADTAPTGTPTGPETLSDTAQDTSSTGTGPQLADTGAVNTTPYVVGGTLFLGLGAGFVAYSVRRERTLPH